MNRFSSQESLDPLATGAEGNIREALAAYFLTVPAIDQQTEAQHQRYKGALCRLLEVETRSVLQFAGLDRPLMRVDMAVLLRNVLEACACLSQARGPALIIGCSREVPPRCIAGGEPRLLQMAAVGLIRASCAVNPDTPVTATLYARPGILTLAVTGEQPARESEALAVAKETARLHRGCLAVCEGTVGLSLRTTLPTDAGGFAAPTVSELLRDSLSSVHVGFYSSFG